MKVEKTRTTPQVDFNNGYIHIEGKSIPVVDPGFYQSLVNMMNSYAVNPAFTTIIELSFDCINAYSKKSMMQVFRILEQIHSNGNRVVVNWCYREEDEAMLELGTIYKSIVKLPFNFICK